MDLPLDPGLALPALPFGSLRSVVHAGFKTQPQVFRRTPYDEEADYWPDLGISAYYDETGRLEALELSAPANPSIAGWVLTSLSLQQAKQVLNKLDRNVTLERNAATSTLYGISIWSGAGTHGQVQAVLRFAPGYYD